MVSKPRDVPIETTISLCQRIDEAYLSFFQAISSLIITSAITLINRPVALGSCFLQSWFTNPPYSDSANMNKNKNEIPVFFIPSNLRKGSGFYYYHYWCTCTWTLET